MALEAEGDLMPDYSLTCFVNQLSGSNTIISLQFSCHIRSAIPNSVEALLEKYENEAKTINFVTEICLQYTFL